MKNHILSFFLPVRGFIEKRGEREREKASQTSDSHFTARKKKCKAVYRRFN